MAKFHTEVNYMKISESNMTLESSGYQKATKVSAASLEVWGNPDSEQGSVQRTDGVSISEAGASQAFFGYHFLSTEEIQEMEELDDLEEEFLNEEDKLKIRLLEAFMSIWLERDFKIKNMTLHTSTPEEKDVENKMRRLNQFNAQKARIGGRHKNGDTGERQPVRRGNTGLKGWGISYNSYEEESKEQRVDFSAKGKVVLEDGREIQVDYRLHMSEWSYKRTSESFKAGDALIDPIVINYDVPSTNLTQEKFEFDIDMDGAKDQISFATKGAGFLAIDKNGNDEIDDGSELFGPRTNDGFSELAEYDDDGNGWIDENDEIFSQLRIWERDESGASKLLSLGEVGIGAIYLKDATTLFDLSDDQLDLQGKVRTSSIFLREDGTAGSVHEIDLVV